MMARPNPTPGRRPGAPPRRAPRAVLAALLLAGSGCGPLGRGEDPLDVLERHATDGAARASESVVSLEYSAADAPAGARRAASGVVISDAGEVLSVRIDPPSTTSGALPIVARLADGRRLPATWVAADARTGLTLLRIPPGAARPAEPSEHAPRPGLPLILIGNNYGMGHTVNRGYVAGTGRRVLYGHDQLGGLIQVDGSVHPGDSGALVADLRGQWLGLIRSGLAPPANEKDRDRDAPRGRSNDLGFAIPARDALWVAGQLRTHGRIERAFLGVRTNPLTAPPEGWPGPGPGPGRRPGGVELRGVVPGSPAALAGLKPGDRILALGGEKVSAGLDLTDILDRTAAGDALTVDYVRPGDDGGTVPLREIILTSRRPETSGDAPKPPADAVAVAEPRPTPPAPDLAEVIARLERRIRDLERAALERDAEVARKP